MDDVVEREQPGDGPQEDEAEAAKPTAGRPRPRLGQALRRLWAQVALAFRWLRKPDEVGRPLTLKPRSLRLLVLLIAGNFVIVLLLTGALYQAVAFPAATPPPRVVVATPTSDPALAPPPTGLGNGGAIALSLRRNGNTDVYALDPANRELVRLTHDPAEDRDPTWSPDGDQIAFASNRAGNWDIYLLDLVSGSLIRLTRDPAFDGHPSWSPDGQLIAFESYRDNSLDVYTMTPEGENTKQITTSFGPDCEPAWSPDSRAIAFSSFRSGNKDIYVRLIDGSSATINVTNSLDLDEGSPAWSPDGARLAYVSNSGDRSSIQVTTFDWDTTAGDQLETELLNAGVSPVWAPEGQNLAYAVRDREGTSHLIATGMTGWAQSQEIYGAEGTMDDLAWTDVELSSRIVARARAADPGPAPPLYAEMVQPTPTVAPPYRLVALPNVEADGQEALLSDRVDESFGALRQRALDETGRDYMATLSSSWVPLTYTPPSGHSRMSWHVCGRAIGLDRAPYESGETTVRLVREDVGSVTYWRVFVRAARQDGSQGEPLREPVWDLNERAEGGRAAVEGGAREEYVPTGYYVDLTALAEDYGWERLPSMWRWHYFLPDVRWWELQKTDGIEWMECMLEVFEPGEIEEAFGPIPGYEE